MVQNTVSTEMYTLKTQFLVCFSRDSIGIIQIFIYVYVCVYVYLKHNCAIIIYTVLSLFSLKISLGDWALNSLLLFNNYMIFCQHLFNQSLVGCL